MKKIMISAGEASGDINGAQLVRAIKELCPSADIQGIGGGRMEASGVRVLYDISELAAVGFSEVLRNFGKIRRVFYGFCRQMDRENPDALVLIDYPGFNMRLAARAKKKNIKVVYYISPQIWAWGRNRVYKIARIVDRMLVIFPFEKDFYRKYGVRADYVGHPISDRLAALCPEEPAGTAYPGKNPVICLLPGSRRQEVARHLPVMFKSAALIRREMPDARFVIGRAGTIDAGFIRDAAQRASFPLEVKENGECEAVSSSDFVIASSGTATVEAAYFKKPMVVIYMMSSFTWVLAKLMVRVENIAMVNVMAGKRLVPEFVQAAADPGRISEAAVSILKNRDVYDKMTEELGGVKKQLGPPGAAGRAARLVLETAGVKTCG